MKHYQVVAATIIHEDQILCVQRNVSKYDYISKKWEFPGGKIEMGESKESAITREISEELKMDISVEMEFFTVNHEYPDFTMTMHSFICKTNNTALTLTEHLNFEWLPKTALAKLDWAAADIPIVEALMKT